MKLIELNIHHIIDLCKRFKVKKLYVFGSILTERFNDNSDVDFSFHFEDDVDYRSYSDLLLGFYNELKRILGREVDLVDESNIQNKYFREELDDTKHLIYG